MANDFVHSKHSVKACLAKFPEKCKVLYYTSDEALDDLAPPKGLDLIFVGKNADLARQFGLRDYESHQGVVLELKEDLGDFLFRDVEDLLIRSSHSGKLVLWLPGIQDPHNLGAVIRSAVAFGQVEGIIIPAKKSVPLNATVAKTSAGTLFQMKFARYNSMTNTAKIIHSAGYQLLGVDRFDEALDITEARFLDFYPFVIAFGSEGSGMPRAIKEQCKHFVKIVQQAETEPLNLSVAVGITLFEIKRQLSTL